MIHHSRFITVQSSDVHTQHTDAARARAGSSTSPCRRSASQGFPFLFSRVPSLMCGLFMRGGGACGELVMQYGSNEKEINTACSVKRVTPSALGCALLLAGMQ